MDDKKDLLIGIQQTTKKIRGLFYQEIFLDDDVLSAYKAYQNSAKQLVPIINVIDLVFYYIERAVEDTL